MTRGQTIKCGNMPGSFVPTGGLPEFVRWIPAGNGRNEGMAFTG
jgi:hypothetical protein